MTSAISIRKASKTYGKTLAVNAVDLEIAPKEFIVILGPSGCGKSTLLRMIAGLEEITKGDVAIHGEIMNRKEPRERGCAMVFQNYALYPHMTVADNIGYALKVSGVSAAERKQRIEAVAKAIGLDQLLERKPGQLSGGQRQRVAMGRAMIREPKVFLFDEPLSNLDATLRVQMRIEIRKLHQRLGTTSVFVTHDQIEAMTLGDRLVIMNNGVIEQVGTPREVYDKPQSRFVAGFIGSPAMNFLNVEVKSPGVAATAGGQIIAYDPAQFHARTGDKLIAGIRPESVQLAMATAKNALSLPLEVIEELGPAQLLHATFENQPFAISTPLLDNHRVNGTVRAIIPHEAVHLFHADTGKRVAATQTSTASLAA